MSLTIHIERLVLDGLNLMPGQRAGLQTAVEAELARLLLNGGLHPELRAGGAVPRLRGGDIQAPHEPTSELKPTPLGQQIARAVYHGVGQ